MIIGARMLGITILALIGVALVSVGALSAWVYSGPEQNNKASMIAREFFHRVYQSSAQMAARPAPSPTAGNIIK
jgi:hypothetical protein